VNIEMWGVMMMMIKMFNEQKGEQNEVKQGYIKIEFNTNFSTLKFFLSLYLKVYGNFFKVGKIVVSIFGSNLRILDYIVIYFI
jgi:hypothetical protein